MTGESIGSNVNVRIREINRITGLTERSIVGHNKITRTGLGILADYISAYFNSGDLLNIAESEINLNKIDYIEKFKALIRNLPYQVLIGTNKEIEETYEDTGIISPVPDPVTKKPISFKLSNGSSTLQSALSGSLSSISTSGYNNGITVSYTFLSRSDTFENFKTNSDGIIVDNENNPMYINELALMDYDNNKCWARISLTKDNRSGLILNKNRVYDILWNINLVSINTQLVETNG